MSTIYRIAALTMLCGIVVGCSKPVEPAKPELPPAPPAKSIAPAATPIVPPASSPLDGPKLPLAPPPKSAVAEPMGAPAVAPSGSAPNASKRPVADDLKVVQSVLAKAMNIKPEAVEPTKTLADLKMSNLDLADAVMELEDKLQIMIPKASLQKAAGTDMPYEVLDKLTVQKFAEVVNASQPKK